MASGNIISDQFRENLFRILHGEIVGYTYRRYRAYTAEPSTTFYSTIWSCVTPVMYPYLSAAQILKVSSTSANDKPLSSGAQTVRISGLDADYNPISEVVVLNGQSPVDTVNAYLRVNSMICETFGSLNYNDGAIYAGSGIITAGVNSSPQEFIAAKIVYSDTGVLTVPAGYTVILYDSEFSVKAGKDCTVRTVARASPSSPFKTLSTVDLFGSARNFGTDTVIKFVSERSDIEFQAIGDMAKAATSVEIQTVLIDNKYI